MGPLFSVALIALMASVFMLVAFVVARIFWRPALAVRLAILFIIGASGGAVLIGGVYALIIGTGVTLTSSGQVMTYLAFLAVGGLIGGILVPWLFLRLRRSN